MAWIYLVIAGLFEVGFTTCLKYSNNFSNWKWSIGFFICITLSFFFLNQSIQKIPIGTAYSRLRLAREAFRRAVLRDLESQGRGLRRVR